MTIRRRIRRNSLKDFLENLYFPYRRFSKELKIQQQFKKQSQSKSKIFFKFIFKKIVYK